MSQNKYSQVRISGTLRAPCCKVSRYWWMKTTTSICRRPKKLSHVLPINPQTKSCQIISARISWLNRCQMKVVSSKPTRLGNCTLTFKKRKTLCLIIKKSPLHIWVRTNIATWVQISKSLRFKSLQILAIVRKWLWESAYRKTLLKIEAWVLRNTKIEFKESIQCP